MEPSVALFFMILAGIALVLIVAVGKGVRREDECEREVFRQIDGGIEEYREEQHERGAKMFGNS